VRRYAFDQSLRRVADFSTLDFTGARTDLGATLQQIRERFAGQPLAGIVLLTDGNATDLPDGVANTDGLPPIYPLVVGRAEGLRDLRIERADPRQTAFDDAPVSLRVQVAGSGIDHAPVSINVRPLSTDASAPSAAPPPKTIHLRQNDEIADAAFEW